jgi:hypothetical protein
MSITDRELKLGCDHKGCTTAAFYVVTGHLLDDCLTPLGTMLCSQHTAELLQHIVTLLPCTCQCCYRKFTKLSELVETSHVNSGVAL